MTDLTVAEAYLGLFEGCDLLAPGGEAETRALVREMELRRGMRVCELGGGSGRAAVQIAFELGVEVAVIENAPGLVRAARARAGRSGVADRVTVHQADMKDAPDLFPPRSFDAVLSEGALYNVGIEAGAALARRLLKPGGVLGFTDLTWSVAPERAARDVRAFWDREAPGILTPVEDKIARLRAAGFNTVASFFLPAEAWKRYYDPVRDNLRGLRARGARSPILDAFEEELRVHDHAGGREAVGYVAFVARPA